MNILELFKPIQTFIFDVDGVLTDGTLQLLENGELSRKMHIKDGYALQLAVKGGYHIAVISGGNSSQVEKRLQGLGIKDIFLGVQDKKEILETYLSENELSPAHVLYMGDDIPDYEAMQSVFLRTCPADASPEIKAICQYVSPVNGGQGCVRDVVEKVMKLRGNWEGRL